MTELREGPEKSGNKQRPDHPRPSGDPPSQRSLAAAIDKIDSRLEGFRTCAAYLLERLGRESLGEGSQPIIALLKSFVDSGRVARREMMKREGQGVAPMNDDRIKALAREATDKLYRKMEWDSRGARWASLMQLFTDTIRTALAETAAEVERLDWMIATNCFVFRARDTRTPEQYIVVQGFDWDNILGAGETPRAAIDDARAGTDE